MTVLRKPAGLYHELIYLVGLPIISLSVVLIIKSGLGVSIVNSIPLVLSRIWTGLSLGTWTYVFQMILMLTLTVLLRRFRLAYVVSFGVAAAFSFFIDLFARLLQTLPVETLWQRALFFGSGMVILPFGIALTILSGLPLMPIDLFVGELSAAWNRPFGRLKLTIDLIYLVIAIALLRTFLKDWIGVGVGTLLTALLNGPMIGFWIGWLKQRFELKSLWKRIEPEMPTA